MVSCGGETSPIFPHRVCYGDRIALLGNTKDLYRAVSPFEELAPSLYFEGRSQIKQDDLVRGFRSMFNEGEGDSGKKEKRKKQKVAKRGQEQEDQVKVALVYFLKGVLLSADAKKNISDFYLSMVDDLAMFNAYPWGSEVYDLTFDNFSTKNLAVKYKEKLAKLNEKQVPAMKETYTLLGFPFSFQVSCY